MRAPRGVVRQASLTPGKSGEDGVPVADAQQDDFRACESCCGKARLSAFISNVIREDLEGDGRPHNHSLRNQTELLPCDLPGERFRRRLQRARSSDSRQTSGQS